MPIIDDSQEQNHELFTDEETLSEELLNHLPDISDEAKRKWPRDLVALLDIYQASLVRLGYPVEQGSRIAHALISELAVYCGGRYIYLPKGDALEKAIRDVRLFIDWRDHQHTPEMLVSKYKISLQHVYRIIDEQRKYHINKIQPGLF